MDGSAREGMQGETVEGYVGAWAWRLEEQGRIVCVFVIGACRDEDFLHGCFVGIEKFTCNQFVLLG